MLYIPYHAVTVKKEYLGQYKRPFGTRFPEHQKTVSTSNGKSALAEHVCDIKHVIDWKIPKLLPLTINNRYGERRCLEAWHINKQLLDKVFVICGIIKVEISLFCQMPFVLFFILKADWFLWFNS